VLNFVRTQLGLPYEKEGRPNLGWEMYLCEF